MKINRGIGLTLIVIFSFLTVTGFAETGVFRPESDQGLITFYTAASGDAAYLCDAFENKYYRIAKGDEIRTRPSLTTLEKGTDWIYRSPLILVGDNDLVYAAVEMTIRQEEGALEFIGAGLYELRFDSLENIKICDLDVSSVLYEDVRGQGILPCISALLEDNQLYLLFDASDEEEGLGGFSGVNAEEASRILLCTNTSTGEKSEFSLEGVTQLVSAKDSEILCARQNFETGGVVLSAFSLKNEEWKDLLDLNTQNSAPPQNIIFDEKNGCVFYSIRNRIWGMRDGKAQPQMIASIPMNYPIGILFYGDNELCVYSIDMACIIPIDWEYKLETRKLVVSGESLAFEEYAAERADIDIAYSDDMSSEQIVNAVLTQSPTPDIFIIDTDYPVYVPLRDRGYLLPLEEADLIAYAEKLHPDILSAVSVNGELCALPTGLTPQPMFALNIDLWNTLGLGNPPQTWEDMSRFLREWPDVAAEFPDVAPFAGIHDAETIKFAIIITVIQEYERYRNNQEELMGYDTQEFRSLMDLFASIDYEALAHEDSESTEWLFTTGYSPTLKTPSNSSIYPLPLSVVEGGPAYSSAIASVMAINPSSKNKDIALDYMQYTVEHLDPVDRLEIMVGENEPIKDAYFEKNLESIDQRISDIEAGLQSATSDSDRERFQSMLENAQETRLNILDSIWAVSAEEIALYRRATKRINVMYSHGINDEDAGNVDVVQFAYAEGRIGLEEFIREMDRLITMREREGT